MSKLSFFRSINLKSLFARRGPALHEKTLAPTSSGRLRHILPVLAYRQGSDEPVRLLCGRLSVDSLNFRTTMEVKPGEVFALELLLVGVGPVKVMGQVKEVTRAGEIYTQAPPSISALDYCKPMTSFSGSLELWTTAQQQESILTYLCREHDTRRGSGTLSSGL